MRPDRAVKAGGMQAARWQPDSGGAGKRAGHDDQGDQEVLHGGRSGTGKQSGRQGRGEKA